MPFTKSGANAEKIWTTRPGVSPTNPDEPADYVDIATLTAEQVSADTPLGVANGITIGTDQGLLVNQRTVADINNFPDAAAVQAADLTGVSAIAIATAVFAQAATNTTAVDDGVDIIVSGDNKRLVRIAGERSFLEFVSADEAVQIVSGASTTDHTADIQAFLELGGQLHFPNGTYNIAAAGANAGGVLATITKDISVTCAAEARFVAGTGLDGDMIRIVPPTNGTGLTRKVNVRWFGGYFDMSGQLVSTSIPFGTVAPYIPANQGASATIDGLSIRGSYNDGGTGANGFGNVDVMFAEFYAGDHWMSAGGDQAVVVGPGTDRASVSNCKFIGLRDLGVYGTTEDSVIAPGGFISITKNYFENCFGAGSVKHSVKGWEFRANETLNCVLGFFATILGGTGTASGIVMGNRFLGSRINVRLDQCTSVTVFGNTGEDYGAFEEDGVTPFTLYQAEAYQLNGCSLCTVEANRSIGVSAAHAADNPRHVSLREYIGTPSEYNHIVNNVSDGFDRSGREEAGEADFNRIENNSEITGNNDFVVSGANTSEIRYDLSTGLRTFMSQQLFADGTAAEPIIARRSQTSTGIGFALNEVFATIAGTKRLQVLDDGLAFVNAVGAGLALKTSEVVASGLTGASVTLAGARPIRRNILSVSARIRTDLAGVTGFSLGDGVDVDRYGTVSGTTAGTTTQATSFRADPFSWGITAEDIVITANGGNFAAGEIVVCVTYLEAIAPTS